MNRLNKHSQRLTQDVTQPAAQAMLYAVGLSDEDMQKPQVGIASTGYDGNPCNMHLNHLAAGIKEEVNKKDQVGLIFNTIGVSDGISMGTSGMNYSLPSRDIIADSIEVVMNAQSYDALVSVVGCDKNMPGAIMAMLRLNRPSLMVYGGTIASGNYKGRKLNIVSAFEALSVKRYQEKFRIRNTRRSLRVPFREQVPVAECIQLIRWHPLLKRLVLPYLIIHLFRLKTRLRIVRVSGLLLPLKTCLNLI